MKSYILVDYIFSGEEFTDEIIELVEDNLDFQCQFGDVYDISFDGDEVDALIEVVDGEENGGSCVCTFDFIGLKQISLDFMYEDGNQYNEVIYKR